MAIDPVCSMQVDEKTATHKHAHAGTTFYFCSAGCRTRFAANPGAYLGASGRAGHGAPMSPSFAGTGDTVASAQVATLPPVTSAAADKAKDPICGMVVDKATALKTRARRAHLLLLQPELPAHVRVPGARAQSRCARA